MMVALAVGALVGTPKPISGVELGRVMMRMSTRGALKAPLDPPDYNAGLKELVDGRDLDIAGASGPLDYDSTTGDAPPVGIEHWVVRDGGFVTLSVEPP